MNRSSITYKMAMLLLAVSFSFIAAVTTITKYLFTDEYAQMEQSKLEQLMYNVGDSLALNMSYGFKPAVLEIGETLAAYENILKVRIEPSGAENTLVFGQADESIEALGAAGHFVRSMPLHDPATSEAVGRISVVYSRVHFDYLVERFYTWMSVAVACFALIIVLAIVYLTGALRPLRRLAESMERFNPAAPAATAIDFGGSSEVVSISRAVETMIASIGKHTRDLRQLNSELLQSRSHLDEAQHMAHVGSWEYHVTSGVFEMSKEMYRILHLNTRQTPSWETFLSFIVDEDRDYVGSVLKGAIENGSRFQLDYQIMSASGDLVDIHTQGKVRKKAGSVRLAAVSMDVTEQNRANQMIEKLAFFDALTELPNRLLFKDRLQKAMRSVERNGGKLAVLFLDLDHFKLINDTLGHDVGDDLLKYVADLMGRQLRQVDTLARIGGDEFMLLLPEVRGEEDAVRVAEKLLDVLQGQHVIGVHSLYITTSIGIALCPDHSASVDSLMKYADIAMYKAKESGRNSWMLYSEEMSAHVNHQMTLERDLRNAVETMCEFELYYQPKIDLETGEIRSVEALIRWNHPEQGILFPDSFIPLAESTGMITAIGAWVMETCMRQIVKWEEEDKLPLRIAINLSGRQFQDRDLIPGLKKLIEAYSVDPSLLEFEITESLSMSNIEGSLRTMHELKSLGVHLAIDDFGTGYSSLAYLKQFPIDVVKIDKSFIMDMTENDDDRAIVQTIISMAHTLNFKAVAEGIEDERHLRMLQDMDCDIVQGYYFSRPLPIGPLNDFCAGYRYEGIAG